MTQSPFLRAALRDALDGISGILVTPFDHDDRLAPTALKPVVDRAVEAGIQVLVANGNTSEFYALSADEALRMVEVAAEHIGGRVPLLGGVGRSVQEACALAAASRRAGAAGVMVHQLPDPFVAPCGLVDYVRRVADARGFTSGLINVFPRHSRAILDALDASDYPKAMQLIDDMRTFEDLRAQENNGTNVSVVKAALQAIGPDCGPARPPAGWPLTEDATRALRDLLDQGRLRR